MQKVKKKISKVAVKWRRDDSDDRDLDDPAGDDDRAVHSYAPLRDSCRVRPVARGGSGGSEEPPSWKKGPQFQ